MALAVFSAVATAALRLQQQGFHTYQRTSLITQAVLLAQTKVTEAQVSPPVAGQGKVPASGGGELFWEVVVTDSPHKGVQAVRIRVRAGAQETPILEVATYVASTSPTP